MKPLTTIFIALLSVSALAQPNVLSKRVSFQYDNVRLKEALADISNRYQVNFSYSSDYIPVRKRVSANAENVPLSAGLNKLFEKSRIVYGLIGSHIVLKIDPNKKVIENGSGQSGQKQKQTPEPSDGQPAVLASSDPEIEEQSPPPTDTVITLQMPAAHTVRGEGKMHPFDETLLNFETWRLKADWAMKTGDNKRIAQISLLPSIGTNAYYSPDLTNNVSLNLIWGNNGGVDGMEVGLGLNMVKNDVKGFQAAGLGNTVGRDVTGTQVGGFFNYAAGTTRGFQAAGVVNFTQNAEAAQVAGIMNWVEDDLSGLQLSGFFNLVGGNADAFQAASAFNYNGGNAKVQVGGIFNVAKDVEIAQVSSLLNVAREVKGFQIALINISDTVSGVPIGLLNIVKRGYNKVEIYGSETLHGNLQLKLGANAFYNIFHVGARYPEGDGKYAWGLGYGIGTVSTLSPKNTLNFELMAIHISENETWTNKLNSIGQFRFLWNHQLGKSIGFFLGPTANVMVSQLQDLETGLTGSSVVPYALLDEQLTTKNNLKGWVGVNAGFRF